MDLKALIDFNKYTLTLSAAAFVYTMSNFVPVKSASEVDGLLFILGCFLAASLSGVLLFAAATSALHKVPASETKTTPKKSITLFGNLHAALLVIGLVALALKLHAHIIDTVPETQVQPQTQIRAECHKICATLTDPIVLDGG
ncbi:MAG: hypothetical protein ACRBBW_20025 [Cellvibrionaceae bacterium]